MANEANLIPFKPGPDARRGRKPKGAKSRATSARKILALTVSNPDEFLKAVQQIFPDALNSIEDLEDVINLKKAQIALTSEKDSDANNAGDSLLDSAYGKPIQTIEEIKSDEYDLSDKSPEELAEIIELQEKLNAKLSPKLQDNSGSEGATV